MIDLNRYDRKLDETNGLLLHGIVKKVAGLVIESTGPLASIGDICTIRQSGGETQAEAEIVGFQKGTMLLMPLGEVRALRPGAEVWPTGGPLRVPVAESMVGRVLSGLGPPLDGRPPVRPELHYPVHSAPPSPLKRRRIEKPLPTGVRSIDALATLGQGQRVGLFAGSGIGKSTLLGMIARYAASDVNVIAMIGERGREVREFIEKDLRAEGLARSVIVVATSDQPALIRIKAALVATAIAEFFRDRGRNVLLMMDSVTRFAVAQREVGLAVGEPPTIRGYPPSTFAHLPRLLERTGQGETGSITGIYTVLVEGDDHNEPVADSVRGILDGHIVLTRELATRNHYPPVDVLASLSRVMNDVVAPGHQAAAAKVRELLAVYRQSEDLIRIGAYAKGSSPEIDRAIERRPAIEAFLRQRIEENTSFEDVRRRLEGLA